MNNNPLLKIKEYGQSIWIDYLDRSQLESGKLEATIESYGICGMTSNPRIYAKAITQNSTYDSEIQAGLEAGQSAKGIFEDIIFQDIRRACDIFRPIYENTARKDGYVSVEISPHLARNIEGTLAETKRYVEEINRENLMVKIPATEEGYTAIERATTEGINVNITLLFSLESYEKTAEAYMRGLEARVKANQPIDRMASVASIFLSRIDAKVDDMINQKLTEIGTEALSEETRLDSLKGKIAIANAKVAYQKHKEILNSERWQNLAAKGAQVQRLLWASTKPKDPQLSDVLYVNETVAPNTVSTLPPATIEAAADRANPSENPIETDVDAAYHLLESLNAPDIGISYDRIMEQLLEEGVEKYAQPYDSLMEYIENGGKKAKKRELQSLQTE
ncbi:MAG: transaldolase [Spirulinaceae cyanobacterium]